MEIERCPLCRKERIRNPERAEGGFSFIVKCGKCGRFEIDCANYFLGQKESIHKSSHILSAFVRECLDRGRGIPKLLGNQIETIIAKCPSTVTDKAHHLLSAFVRRSRYFGDVLYTDKERIISWSYAYNVDEAVALVQYLYEKGFIRELNIELDKIRFIVSASGYETSSSRALLSPLSVFVSSTCYDLIDLRLELAIHLESQGAIVKLSEDPERFAVDPTGDSIETCLRNIDSSEIVVCVVDRRYGGVFASGPHAGKSATQVEIEYARSLSPRKPILFFMRDRAWNDYELLKGNIEAETRWVEPRNTLARKSWLLFANSIAAYPEHRGVSNWVTLFRSSNDLRRIVTKRLADATAFI
jgi:hypothetical protein